MTGMWVAPVIDITLDGSCVWLKYIPVIVDVLCFYLDDRFRLTLSFEHFLMFDDRCRLKPVIRERPRAERKLATQ